METPNPARKALVVDDEPRLRSLICAFLARGQWPVASAAGASEALDVLEGGGVTHAIVDLHLGTESGLDLIREIAHRWPQVRIVAMTGAIMGNDEAARLAGASDVLSKPVRGLQTIERALLGPALGEVRHV